MAKALLTAIERHEIELLIIRLDQTPLLSIASIRERKKEFEERRTKRVFEDGLSWGEASDDLPIYAMEQNDFFIHIKDTDNDIRTQIERFNFGLDQWFKVGETHPPYFPWRIIIILSKRGERILEQKFLAAYCRHFHDGARRGSRTDEKIVERAIKKGAWDYWQSEKSS